MLIKKENRITSIGLLSILLFISFICITIGFIFEKYIKLKENKIFFRIMLLTILLNICILFFLIYSFSKTKFSIGPQGPKGIRGRQGLQGNYDTVVNCTKQNKTLGDIYIENIKNENILLQKPVIGFTDKY